MSYRRESSALGFGRAVRMSRTCNGIARSKLGEPCRNPKGWAEFGRCYGSSHEHACRVSPRH